MKRFGSLVTTAALAGSLIGAARAARASSEMYLVPISPLNASYAPGAIVKFAAVIDLNNGNFASLTVPFATAFTSADFTYQIGSAGIKPRLDSSAPNHGLPSQIDPNSGGYVFPFNAQSYTTTVSKINGNTVYTFQNTVGQTADTDNNGNTVAFPAGTYTIGVFAFPISASVGAGSFGPSSVTIYLPTPYGFSDNANSTDGAYNSNLSNPGPALTINGNDVNHNPISEPIVFPSNSATPADGKYSSLTYLVNAGALYGTINLGLASNAPPQPITIIATSETTHQTQTFVVPISGSNNLYNVGILPDTYDVTIQGSKWLKQQFTGIRVYTNYDYGYIYATLTGGDANGDNSVDSTDFGLLIGAYGSSAAVPDSGYIAGADFNCDGLVDSTDFGILINAFGAAGAP